MTEAEALAIAVEITRQNEAARDQLPRRLEALTVLRQHGWTYQRIADALGVTKSAVAAIVKGKP